MPQPDVRDTPAAGTAREAAPWYGDGADIPDHGITDGGGPRTVWLTTIDGVRLRAAVWAGRQQGAGTVLLLPGRTEPVEKYHRVATDLNDRGYAVVAIDWRGQGLSDRALPDRMLGHVEDFAEYQHDLDALVGLAKAEAAAGPWFMLAHSMGGAIGLAALMRGLPVQAAVFSAPMWGIAMTPLERPTAHLVSAAAWRTGGRGWLTPSEHRDSYLLRHAFAGNELTGDRATWDWMRAQLLARPELALGGPSLGWLRAALRECRRLGRLPSPEIPCLTTLGTAEKIVDPRPIRRRMARWPGGRLDIYPGGAHEVMMEVPAMRDRFLAAAVAHFLASAG